jgi:hypothetical protein
VLGFSWVHVFPFCDKLVEMLRRRFEDFANIADFGVSWFHPIGSISKPHGSIRPEIDDRLGSTVFAVNVAGFVVCGIDAKDASAEPYAAHPSIIT